MDLPFLEQLDAVAQGQMELSAILATFLVALEANMAELQEALAGRPEARVKSLVDLLDIVHERFHDCHGLVRDALDDPRPGDLARLKQSHSRLDQALTLFHEACWVHRGPTSFGWVNRILESLERFLQGECMDPGLSALLDGWVLSLEKRGAARVEGSARDLLFLLRPLADWARGSILLTPADLQFALAGLADAAELAGDWLREARSCRLEQLLACLRGDATVETVLPVARGVLEEIDVQLGVVATARDGAGQASHSVLGEVQATLRELRLIVGALIDDLEGTWEWDFHDQLRDLFEDLCEHMVELAGAVEQDGSAPCPSCRHPNPRQSRRCQACSVMLPAVAEEQRSLVDLRVSAELEEPEEANVARLRLACEAFADERLSLADFRDEVEKLRALAVRAREVVPGTDGPLQPREEEYRSAMIEIERTLSGLACVEHPQEAGLFGQLEGFVSACARLRSLLQPSQAELDLTSCESENEEVSWRH